MSLDVFLNQAKDLGRKAAKARYQRDESLASFFRESLRKIKAVLINREDKRSIETAYCMAYREEYQSLSPNCRPN